MDKTDKKPHVWINVFLMIVFGYFAIPFLIAFIVELCGERSLYVCVPMFIITFLFVFGFIFNLLKYRQKKKVIAEQQSLEYDVNKLIPIEIYNRDKAALQARIDELEKLTNSYNDEQNRFQSRIKELEGIVLSYKNEKTNFQARIAELENAERSNNYEKTHFQARIAELENNVRSYQNRSNNFTSNLVSQNTYSVNNVQATNTYVQKQTSEMLHLADESLGIAARTCNPEIFFSRIKIAIDKISECVKYENNGMVYPENNSPSKVLKQFEDSKPDYIDEFIINSYNMEMSKANELKSQAGRDNRIKKYFDSLSSFENEMTPQNLETIQRLKDSCNFYNEIDSAADNTSANEMSASIKIDNSNKPTPPEYITKNVSPETFEHFKKVVFLSWASRGYAILQNENYPEYFKYNFNITDPHAYHSRLAAEGLLQKADGKAKLSQLKVPEIKELLKKYGISVKGKKQDLIDSALSKIGVENIERDLAYMKTLMLTEKGTEFLAKNSGYVKLHRNQWNIYLYEYEQMRKKGFIEFDDAAEQILLKRDDSPCSFSKESLAGFYLVHEKYGIALSYYIETVYYECCNHFTNDFQDDDFYDDDELPEDDIFISPMTIRYIHDLKEYYTSGIAAGLYEKNSATKCFYNKDDFVKLINKMVYSK